MVHIICDRYSNKRETEIKKKDLFTVVVWLISVYVLRGRELLEI